MAGRLKSSRKVNIDIKKDFLDKFFKETLNLLRFRTLRLIPTDSETVLKSL
ncbi:hypothetical protein SUSAZ_05255 [Sulfolobus acidocaldarius SUSAZ]|nr:hypothetical protein SUSAZ_05255 [Sulfolobus acidocaldarius SUSAZ]